MSWQSYPFARLTLLLAIGILFRVYAPLEPFIFYLLLALAVVALLGFAQLKPALQRQLKAALAPLISAAVVSVGYLVTEVRTPATASTYFARADSVFAYIALVDSEPYFKGKSVRAKLKLQQVRSSNGWQLASGYCNAYFVGQAAEKELTYGDVLLVKGAPEPQPGPANPKEFNYRQYLSFHGIYHRQLLRAGEFSVVNSGQGTAVIAASLQARTYLISIFEHYLNQEVTEAAVKAAIPGSSKFEQQFVAQLSATEAVAVASALVLGQRSGLNRDLQQSYASAGATHVLAVSGLHVGILLQVVVWLFGPLRQKKLHYRLLYLLVSLSLLWGFAFITGLSPSVLRAATMFSFVAVGQVLTRNSNIYNTLAVSGFVLLVINPYLLFEVGFQLSYLAIFGIVLLQSRIELFWKTDGLPWLIRWGWKIFTVSVAAQIATFPLGLLYFHQFPFYFWISNFFVIPLAGFLLNLAVLLFLFSWVPVVAQVLGSLYVLSISLMNWLVHTVEQLPLAVFEGIYITTFQVWVIYALVLFFLLYFFRAKKVYAWFSLIISLILSFTLWQQYAQQAGQQLVAVYRVNGEANLAIIKAEEAVLVADSALSNNADQIRFAMHQHWFSRGVNDYTTAVSPAAFASLVPVAQARGTVALSLNNNKLVWLKAAPASAEALAFLLQQQNNLILIERPALAAVTKQAHLLRQLPESAKLVLGSSVPSYQAAAFVAQFPQLKTTAVSLSGGSVFSFTNNGAVQLAE